MIRFRALGTVELARDGEPLRALLAQPKSLALLAYLAFARPGPFHRRDTLLGLFWPEADNGGARASLRAALHRLRRSLGDEALARRGNEEVGLDGEALWSDVTAFEGAVENDCLRDAAELYRGDLLPGFFLSDAPAFDQWLEARRLELRKTAARATWALVERLEREGDLQDAVRWAQEAAAHAPFNESAQQRLIGLLDRAGNRAGALQAYDRLVERLRSELEVHPAPETEALVREIREREEVSGAAVTPPGSARPAPEEVTPEPARFRPRGAAPSSRRMRYAAALSVVGIGAFALTALSSGSPPPSDDPIGPPAVPDMSGPGFHHRRVIVVPFQNRTGDPSLEVIGQTAAEWTAQGLMGTGMVEVVSPGEVLRNALAFQRETGAGPGPELAMELAEGSRARILVSGSYQLEEDSLVFEARITDASNGTMLRAVPRVEGNSTAPEALLEPLRQRILGSLATVLDPRLGSWSAAASQPPSFEAYRLYAEGLELFFNDEPIDAALRLREAWSRDTTFTAPLIWAAFAYGVRNPGTRRDAVIAQLAARRDRMPPWDGAMTDFILALSGGNADAAVDAARRAVGYAPDSEWIYKVGWAAVLADRYEEALDALGRIDPDRGWMGEFPGYWIMLGSASHGAGDHERTLEAIRVLRDRFEPGARKKGEILSLIGLGRLEEASEMAVRDVIEVADLENPPAYVDVFDDLAVALRSRGRHEAADSLAQRALAWYEGLPDSSTSGRLGRYGLAKLIAQVGDFEEAAAIFAGLTEEPGPHRTRTMSLGRWGIAAVRAGDTARAMRILESMTTETVEADTPDQRRQVAQQRARWGARIATELGRTEQAIRLWRRAREHRLDYYRLQLESHALHDHPAMQEVLAAPWRPVTPRPRTP